MKKYKVIAFLFLVLFSYQLAPVGFVGLLLSSNQITEELPHGFSGSGSHSHPPVDCLRHEDTLACLNRNLILDDSQGRKGILGDSCIHSRCADDIQTPPPNHSA